MKKKQKILYQYDGENPDEKKKKIDMQLLIMEQTQQNMSEISQQVKQAAEKDREER